MDATVQDEGDYEHPKMNQPHYQHHHASSGGILSYLSFGGVIRFFETYGWYILIGIIALYFIFRRFRSQFSRLNQRIERHQYDRIYTENVLIERQEAMERARRRLQEQSNSQTEEWKVKQKQRDEEKRKERLEQWDKEGVDRKGPRRLGRPDDPPAGVGFAPRRPGGNRLRQSDYNPLIGQEAPRYRPSGGSCDGPV